ncbi:MAG: PepSY domain-containing protein [Bacillaceae bacterium]|nr:PepSY domain-containing protein [Bacillaceae bacterium]
MRKILNLFLSSSLMIGGTLTALVPSSSTHADTAVKDDIVSDNQETNTPPAEVKISKSEALEIAETYFDQSFEDANISYYSDWYRLDHMPVWQINLRKELQKNKYEYFSIVINGNSGEIHEVNYNTNASDELTFPPKINWEDGKKIASEFIKKQFSDKYESVQLNEYNKPSKPSLNENTFYYYTFQRVVDGAPFSEHYLQITLNGNGKITSYRMFWDEELTLPAQKVAISKDEARQMIKDNLDMYLSYNELHQYFIMEKEENRKAILLYNWDLPAPYLDAATGKWIDSTGKEPAHADQTNEFNPISEDNLDLLRVDKQPLTEEEAKAFVRKHFPIPEQSKLRDSNYYENQSGKPVWNFSYEWQKEEEERPYHIQISIHAGTGEVESFSIHHPSYYESSESENKQNSITFEEAKEKAIETVKNWVPSHADEITLTTTKSEVNPGDASRYHFSFKRLKNGIPVMNNGVTVSIFAQTGEVIGFHKNWDSDIEFPKPEQIVSKEDVLDQLFEQYDAQLRWVATYPNRAAENGTLNSDDMNQREYRKAYLFTSKQQLSEPIYLDAFTGKWHSRTTGEQIVEHTTASDIQGLDEQRALELMILYGAIKVDETGKVYPMKDITRGEMIKMLMLANNPDPIYYQKVALSLADQEASFNDVGYGSEYFPYVEEAVRNGYIEDGETYNPEEKITRIEIARLIVNALGYKELANVNGLFTQPFEDLENEKDANIASMIHYLDITDLEAPSFHPDYHVTRAEAAQMFYQYLKARSLLK